MRIGLVIFTILGLGLLGSRPLAADITGTSATGIVVVQLDQKSSSGQTGTATLTSTIDNKTQVVIELKGEPPDAQEPAHIHTGTCKKLNPKPAYPLTNVSGGTSTTTVNASLSSLETGRFAVNVHEWFRTSERTWHAERFRRTRKPRRLGAPRRRRCRCRRIGRTGRAKARPLQGLRPGRGGRP